eukprot:4385497-Pyramimonas_sp.AAC.1
MTVLDPNRRFDGSYRKPRRRDEECADDEGERPPPRAEFIPRHRVGTDRRGLGAAPQQEAISS